MDNPARRPSCYGGVSWGWYPHGGVHANFNTGTADRLREILQQRYTVIAQEYRGSIGYGAGFYRAIEYGGLQIEDTHAASNIILENSDFLEENRVGLVG